MFSTCVVTVVCRSCYITRAFVGGLLKLMKAKGLAYFLFCVRLLAWYRGQVTEENNQLSSLARAGLSP